MYPYTCIKSVLGDSVPSSLTGPNNFPCTARIMIRYLVIYAVIQTIVECWLYSGMVIYLVFNASLPMMQFGRDAQYLVFHIKVFFLS